MLSRALVGTPVDPGGALLVGLVAHGRAHVGVDGQRDPARAADALGDAAQELALLALRAVRVQRANHVHRADALGLGGVAPGLRTPILQQEVGAQIVDDALHGPVLPRLGLEGARQALATIPAAEAGAKGLTMPGKIREGNDEEKGSVAQKMCHFGGCEVEPRISVLDVEDAMGDGEEASQPLLPPVKSKS